jgi:methyl-accepting chemotaxis protein
MKGSGMSRNPSLRFKIASGYAFILILAMVLGGLALWSMKQVDGLSMKLSMEYIPQVGVANNVERYSLDTMYHLRGYALSLDKQYLDAGRKGLGELKKYLDEAKRLASRYDDLAQMKEALVAAEGNLSEFERLVNETVDKNDSIDNVRKEMDLTAGKFMETAMDLNTSQNKLLSDEIQASATPEKLVERHARIKSIEDVIVYGNWIRTASFKFQALRDTRFINRALQNFKELEKMLEAMKTQSTLEQDRKDVLKLITQVGPYRKTVEDLLANWYALDEISKKREAAGDQLLQIAAGMAKVGMEHVNQVATTTTSSLSSASLVMSTGQGIVLVLGILLAVVIIRSITKPINQVVGGLTESAQRVTSASAEVSSSSEELAEGASEQAASIEETSSSLEEMSSMTKQNANNAEQANFLMRTTRETVSRASGSMEKLTVSMTEISKASEDTSKIIKTIDEIAFQTNLLALNAAVEAARAGEAGAGFAVVADEVRNLAMRAAEAARSTSDLIEGTVKKVKEGSDLLGLTDGEFREVAVSVDKSAELVGEIAAASYEQSQGIEQINKAVVNMDTIVQRNASNAEESASASREMNAQAEQMKGFVGALTFLVDGDWSQRKIEHDGKGKREKRMPESANIPGEVPGAIKGDEKDKAVVRKAGIAERKLIPFDEDIDSDF